MLLDHLQAEIDLIDEITQTIDVTTTKNMAIASKLAKQSLEARQFISFIREIVQVNKSVREQSNNSTSDKPKESRHFTLDTIITFGKHRGKTIREVKGSTPDYIDWMRKEFTNDTFDLSEPSKPDLNSRVAKPEVSFPTSKSAIQERPATPVEAIPIPDTEEGDDDDDDDLPF